MTTQKTHTPIENPDALSNFDRLRMHLKKNSLAITLLDAWVISSPSESTKKMLKALENFYNSIQVENESNKTKEN